MNIVAVATVFQLGTILAEHRRDVEAECTVSSCLRSAARNGFPSSDAAPPVDGRQFGAVNNVRNVGILYGNLGVRDSRTHNRDGCRERNVFFKLLKADGERWLLVSLDVDVAMIADVIISRNERDSSRKDGLAQFERTAQAAEGIGNSLKGIDCLSVDIVQFDRNFFVGTDSKVIDVLLFIKNKAELNLIAWAVAISVGKEGNAILCMEGVGLVSEKVSLRC